ncbi:MAG: L-ribulose-5-phosphate 4-epimerase [Ktedonobacteraceae bacterium]
MRLPELRSELARYARKMYESQLVQATQGNVSVRDSESGLICITPSGADYQLLSAEDIVVVNENSVIVEGKWQPSVETPLHTLLLRLRSDIHCVMHTHSPYATAFSLVHQPIPMFLAESALCLGSEISVAPYMMSGTPTFAEHVAKYLGNRPALLWGNHGAMVVGQTLSLTFSIAHALEDCAKTYTIAKQLGTLVPLPDGEVERLHTFWVNHYGQKALNNNNL